MDLPSTTVVSAVQSRSRTSKSTRLETHDKDVGTGALKASVHGFCSSSLFCPPPFVSPVAASKSGLSRTPSRKKKTRRGPVIKITEMSEKYLSQESEASE